MRVVFTFVDGAQVCTMEQRPSSLLVGPVVTVMGSLQTPTPNSTGMKQYPSIYTILLTKV